MLRRAFLTGLLATPALVPAASLMALPRYFVPVTGDIRQALYEMVNNARPNFVLIKHTQTLLVHRSDIMGTVKFRRPEVFTQADNRLLTPSVTMSFTQGESK